MQAITISLVLASLSWQVRLQTGNEKKGNSLWFAGS